MMMRSFLLTAYVLHLLTSAMALAEQPSPRKRLSKEAGIQYGRANEIHVNRMHVAFTAAGGLDNDNSASSWVNGWNDEGVEYPVFDQGLWVLGKRGALLGGLPYFWNSPYARGPVINGRPALDVRPQDSLRYRVYSVTRGETADLNPDIGQWPADFGAPIDSGRKPKILGDQTLWSVYNGLDTTNKKSWNYVRTPSPAIVLPVEIRQTVFAHFSEATDTTLWASSVFFEWAIYNTGAEPLDSVYFSLWTDIDLLNYNYTMPGVDTVAQAGYCWHKPDSTFAAIGYTLLYGPIVPAPGETAIFFGKQRPGYRNLPLNSFWPFIDDVYPCGDSYGFPPSLPIAWNLVRGFAPTGAAIIDSSTRRATRFPFSGDPISGRGSVCPWPGSGGGAGFMMNVGPCSIAAHDSQWIMVALMPAMKQNGIDAINRLRMNAALLRALPYDSLVSIKPRRAVPTNPLPQFDIPRSFAVRQNFPNPFNSATVIPFDLPERSRVKVRIVNVLGQRVATLADDVLERGVRTVSWSPYEASGIYFVQITAESLESPQRWSGMGKLAFIK